MKYFGTDGVRGVANEKLTALMAFKIGQYLGYSFAGNNIIIGSDTRASKDMFASALSAGLTSAGANVYLVGVCPTPCISYLTKNRDFKAGIMISASHNPFYDNGIKIFNEFGEKINASLEKAIEEYIDDLCSIKLATSQEIGQVIDYSQGIEDYLSYLMSTTNQDLSNFKILVDCANGSASYISVELLEKLNIKADIIACQPDGYNINFDCGSTHLENLSKAIKNGSYDLGIAFDGDADRMLVVDNQGNHIDGDLIMYVCALALIQQNRLKDNSIVTTVMSNLGFYNALDNAGIKYEQTAVGDKYVYERLVEKDLSLGGEQSGHIIFKEFASTGDGLLSMIQLLSALNYLEKDLTSILSAVEIYPQILVNVKVEDKDLILNDESLKARIVEIEKELDKKGRVLLRASGTEPLIRVMVEANDKHLCEKYTDELVKLVQEI